MWLQKSSAGAVGAPRALQAACSEHTNPFVTKVHAARKAASLRCRPSWGGDGTGRPRASNASAWWLILSPSALNGAAELAVGLIDRSGTSWFGLPADAHLVSGCPALKAPSDLQRQPAASASHQGLQAW